MLKDLAVRRGKKLPDGEFAKTLSMKDNADIMVDVRTGWVNRLTLTRSINLGTRTQVDSKLITRAAQ